MKFKVKGTDLLVDGKKYKEGAEIELTKEQAKGIEKYLEPVEAEEPKKKGGKR